MSQLTEQDIQVYSQIPLGGAIDLSTKKFGRLQPLYRVNFNEKKGVYWLCQCECGYYTIVLSQNLVQNKIKSCGCLNKETSRKLMKKIIEHQDQPWNKQDLTGKTFGEWTVLKRDETNIDKHHTKYICQCSCGNIKSVYGTNLGRISNSCGCNKRSIGEQKIKEILNQNNILYICEYSAFNYPNSSHGKARFDFYVNNKYFIEYDGTTHYKPIGGWNTFDSVKAQQERDIIKNQWCKDNNIPLIRIPYTHLKDLKLEDLLLETSQFIVN